MSNASQNEVVEQTLQEKFEINALGQPKMLLGMGITQNTEDFSIKLFQTAYIDSLFKRHGLEDANPVSKPMDPNIKLNPNPDEPNEPIIQEESNKCVSGSYATLIGSLIYLAIRTRPNIAYPVQRLAQFT